VPESSDFFVGYQPTPRRLTQFLQAVVVGAVFGVSVLSALLSVAQRDPGPGRWDDDQMVTVEGNLRETPYPNIDADGPLLLVGQGKRGAGERTKGLDGMTVRLRGSRLQRDGLRLLELAEDDDAVEVLGHGRTDVPEHAPRSPVTVRGELVDPKCFCGAMKPGDGKTHKGCAALCLRGGIPPVLVTRDGAGKARYYVLADASGGRLKGDELARVVSFAGDLVELNGTVVGAAEPLTLRVDVSTLRRL
jgi:hypothetical protein